MSTDAVRDFRRVLAFPEGHTATANARGAGATCAVGYDKAVHDSMSMCPTRVSLAFFSDVNVGYLSRRLQHEFRDRTGIVIDRQRAEDLLTVMRYVYVSRARNVEEGYEVEQLAELNTQVIRTLLPQIATSVEQHLHYLRDASVLPTPMERGIATTVKGENPVVFENFF